MQKLKNLLIPVFIIFIAESINIYCLDVYEFSFGGKKYEIVKEKKNWIEAASVAVSRGGYLVQIVAKLKMMQSIMQSQKALKFLKPILL